jgi:replicative DNA helicase
MTTTIERPALCDDLAERRVIGACLGDPDAIEIARVECQAGDFYRLAHAALFRLVCRMEDHCHPVDVATVADALRRTDALDRVGGAGYLLELVDQSTGTGSVAWYCRKVREMAIRRNLVAAAERTITRAHDLETETSTVQDLSESDVLEASAFTHVAIPSWQEVADEAWRSLLRGERGVRPFLGCLHRGDVAFPEQEYSLVGATRGTGKTSFALEQTRYLCKAGAGVIGFSLEMGRRDIYQRLVAMEMGIGVRELRRTARIESVDIEDAWGRVKGWPLLVDDRSGLCVTEIAAAIRRTRRQMEQAGTPLALAWVDYAQLVSAPGAEPGYQSMSVVANDLRIACKGLGVPTILLSQVSEEQTRKGDGFPKLHAKNSRELEDAAGLIVYLHRPGRDGKKLSIDEQNDPDQVKLLVAKARQGGEERIYKAAWRSGPGGYVDRADEPSYTPPVGHQCQTYDGGEPDYGDPFTL